jgi:alkylhydroperoxidase/carboxymuconolactone decarboxylase family protein YurZ
MSSGNGDAKEAKRKHLYERYNNRGLDTGVRLQGEHFLNRVEEFDELDQEWTDAWLTWIYDHMYNRGVLDDKTRILAVLGQCCVLGATMQIPNHIRSAMRAGATKEECLEIILQSAIYGGIPKMVVAMKAYRALMADLGELDLTEPVFRGDARE